MHVCFVVNTLRVMQFEAKRSNDNPMPIPMNSANGYDKRINDFFFNWKSTHWLTEWQLDRLNNNTTWILDIQRKRMPNQQRPNGSLTFFFFLLPSLRSSSNQCLIIYPFNSIHIPFSIQLKHSPTHHVRKGQWKSAFINEWLYYAVYLPFYLPMQIFHHRFDFIACPCWFVHSMPTIVSSMVAQCPKMRTAICRVPAAFKMCMPQQSYWME